VVTVVGFLQVSVNFVGNRNMSLIEVLREALILSLPLAISGAIHMVVVKLNLFPFLRIPIHARLFGSNKTWRGVFVMPLATVLGVLYASSVWPEVFDPQYRVSLGLLLGFAYILAEFPNSYVKRRIGIPPGKRAQKNAILFAFIDQADSALGCMIVYYLVLDISILILCCLVLCGALIHMLVNACLYMLKLRKEPL
jgi:CDP-diacylglycerol--serine O-phosphatidyltransferase